MKPIKARCLILILLILAARTGAQEYNSVPLDHSAYEVIETGVMLGIIVPPPSAKPWPVNTVVTKLWEMMDDPAQLLSSKELETVERILDSFIRIAGRDPRRGRERTEGENYTFEIGYGWESVFSVEAPGGSVASINQASVYAGGDRGNFLSWNITALGDFLYIGREEHGLPDRSVHLVPPFFPNSFSKQWDGRVTTYANNYSAWPDTPGFAGGFTAELNGIFYNDHLQLRLGRIRRDWGPELNGSSLSMNAQARPFTALEGIYSPLWWLDISFLNGALEYFREDSYWPDTGPLINMLSMVQAEANPLRFLHFSMGGSAIWLKQVNLAFFTNLELRMPGLLKIWGSLFVDQLSSVLNDFSYLNSNNYAYQAGLKTLIHWLPFGVFTLRYTKVEPFCYTNDYNGHNGEGIPSASAYINGGESLGHYIPPNSDELLIRIESRPFPEVKSHVQFQMMRHGVQYGYGAVLGSSLWDSLTVSDSAKYFLMDGVYRWDNVIKIGGACTVRAGVIPVSVFAETGVIITRFTINGSAGAGNEAEYESLNDGVYSARTGFIFSIGFRLFP